jgi:hypothetical protein
MKTKALLFAVLVSFFFFSCDSMMFTGYRGQEGLQGRQGDQGDKGPQGNPGEDAPVTPPNNPSEPLSPPVDPFAFISLTVERNEKYHLVPDPVDPNKKFDFISPPKEPISSLLRPCTNQISLFAVPFINLLNVSPSTVRATGRCAVRFNANNGIPGGLFSNVEFPFDIIMSVTPSDYSLNEYIIPYTFTSTASDLLLPKTSNYSSNAYINSILPISIHIDKARFESLLPPLYTHVTVGGLSGGIEEYHGTDFTITLYTNERHKLKSRNFYEYKSLKVAYPPEVTLLNITPSSIVQSHDYNGLTNSLSVILNDYNDPYIGDVVSYILVDTGTGNINNKTIKIVD